MYDGRLANGPSLSGAITVTYCLAFSLNAGLVFASDSRTNAGVDYVTIYRKMRIFTPAEDRLFVVLSSGNLATTQEVINRLQRDLHDQAPQSMLTVNYLFEAARYLGQLSRAVQLDHGEALSQSGISGETSFIVGGQIGEQPQGLYMVYPQGNYVAASTETPYLQLGESKYGKPVVDRIIDANLSLEDAARLALVSMESTSRSNISVGPPFEVALVPRGSFSVMRHLLVKPTSPIFASIKKRWQEGLMSAFKNLPRFDWEH